MDPLSDVLALLDVESVLSASLQTRGPFAIRYPAFRHMKFGSLIAGDRWIWVEGGQPIRLHAGDFYLLTTGCPYYVASDPMLDPVDGVAIFARHRGSDGVVRYGDTGEQTIAAAGRFTFANDEMHGLLGFLPPLIRVARGSPGGEPLAALLPLIAAETSAAAPGSLIAAANLANLVLVQIIRAHIAAAPSAPGWLGAMLDPQIRAALSSMHGDVNRRWTVDLLARSVGLSRTAFSERFRKRVGRPPLEYLTYWRMMVAGADLRRGRRPLADVAEAVGYGSDTAFSIAFKRVYGISPGNFRARASQALASIGLSKE